MTPLVLVFSEMFGEGLAWAGCSIIFLLGQVSKFNVFDFSYHLANVASVEKDPLPSASGVDLSKMVELANFYKAINDDIFIFLELVSGSQPPKVGVFHPPTSDTVEGTYTPAAGEHGTGKRVVTEKKVCPLLP